MSGESFKYYAFISYSHKDKRIAKKLQKRLEGYHLPAALLKSFPELPEKLSPIFIDESDLVAIGSLRTALQANLDRSKYLILICSPSSAQSKYVNDEVAYFIKIGRGDHIIPLIVEGTPHAKDSSQECFPPAILNLAREDEPLGIDLRAFRRRDAFLRVIATLLELDLDSFISRDTRERRKKALIFAPIVAVLAIVAGIFAWYNTPHYCYYSSYIYRWEKPVGLFEVKSEARRKKMEYTYRFTTLRGEVKQIERINSAGTLVEPHLVTPLTELPMIRFVSDRTVEYYDLDGHKVFRKEYTRNMQAVDFYCGDSDVTYALPSDMNADYDSGKYNPEFSLSQNGGNITRWTLEYDENGYVIKKMFRRDNHGGRDQKGTPAQDEKGRWGLSYTVDESGRVTGIHNLDLNGEAMSVHGVYSEYMDYEDKPHPVKYIRADKNGNPVLGSQGFAVEVAVYDEYFNVKKWSCYGINGERVLHTDFNVSETVCAHNPNNGFLVSESFYDTNLDPCLHRYGYSSFEDKFNEEGRLIERSFYGVNKERIICSSGYASFYRSYNEDGKLSHETYADTEGNPAIDSSSNVYGIKYSYEDGFLKRIDKLDAEGNLMLDKNGCASIIREYDKELNKIICVTFRDTEDKRVLILGGVAEKRITYNYGNIASESFYDEHGRPTTNASGVSKYVYGWENGNMISQQNLDKDGKPTVNAQGYARAEYEYNENGLKLWERYYDADGKRVTLPRPEGYSAIRYTYDNRGNKTSETYYDAEDNHAIMTNEYYCYAKEFEYSDDGNLTHIRYLREENEQYQAMLDHQVKDEYIEYNSHGKESKLYWLNSKGEEVNPNGIMGEYASVRKEYEYDAHGRVSRLLEYRRGETEAWIIDTYKVDAFGRIVFQSGIRYIGDMKEFIAVKYEYDIYGNLARTCFLDEHNNLVIPSLFLGLNQDYAIEKVKYDIFGHETDTWYYDDKGEPLSTETRAFHTVRTYDVKGNVLSESYYDEKDNPTVLSGGYHKKVCQYDAQGHRTEEWMYGTDGNLMRNGSAGCHTVASYDRFGRRTSLESYDAFGKPFFSSSIGAFRVVYAHDSYGNESDYWYFGVDGKPCQSKSNAHHKRRSYDAMGHLLSEEYFDTEEKPCAWNSTQEGFHKVLYVYNAYGLLSEEAYFDSEQELLARRLISYDSNGQRTGDEWAK